MANGHPGIPAIQTLTVLKSEVLETLRQIDCNEGCRARVLRLETEFRTRIQAHSESLPASEAVLAKFNTNPFVLLFHTLHRRYSRISQLEADILPAKLFSSMETSAGRIVEETAIPRFGWERVASGMHTLNSAIDGRKLEGDLLRLATLKSGPRCLNDEMSENFADTIINNSVAWARASNVRRVEFTYGVLYGTPRLSNKKDWHILRNIEDKLPAAEMTLGPTARWNCAFTREGIDVSVTVRIGSAWWLHLGGPTCLVELLVAMIRACVTAGPADAAGIRYSITDLAQITSMNRVPADYNVGLLQRDQLPWLFFMMRHFGDHIS